LTDSPSTIQEPELGIFAGIVSRYTYAGVRLTFFPLHQEDGALLSANILLTGGAKIWIILNAQQLETFKKAFENLCSPCVLKHKKLFVHPRELIRRGVGFSILIQKPMDLVITHHDSVHMGWNDDANFASAVNFIDSDWLDASALDPEACEALEVPTDSIMVEDDAMDEVENNLSNNNKGKGRRKKAKKNKKDEARMASIENPVPAITKAIKAATSGQMNSFLRVRLGL
jgi:hypothetical protein